MVSQVDDTLTRLSGLLRDRTVDLRRFRSTMSGAREMRVNAACCLSVSSVRWRTVGASEL
jgi:hypothetical protein